MKHILLASLIGVASTVGFSQEVRDHRSGSGSRPKTNPVPVNPPPVAGKPKPGPAASSIDPGKWYYIRLAGTDKYMEISGHRDPARSMAFLAVENLHQDNISQQWRITLGKLGSFTTAKVENRKYRGDLYRHEDHLFLESRRGQITSLTESRTLFNFYQNEDKTWFIRTSWSENSSALDTENNIEDHCTPFRSKPLVGGRVLDNAECADKMRREYVIIKRSTGIYDQKWILEEVRER